MTMALTTTSSSWLWPSSQIISNFLLICIMISSASLAAEDPLDANSRRNRQSLLLNSCQFFLLSTLPGFLLSTFQVLHFSRLSNQNHFAGSWVTLTTSSQQCSLSRSCWKCLPMVLFKREDICDHQVWMTEEHDEDFLISLLLLFFYFDTPQQIFWTCSWLESPSCQSYSATGVPSSLVHLWPSFLLHFVAPLCLSMSFPLFACPCHCPSLLVHLWPS